MKPKTNAARLKQEIDENLKRVFDDVVNEDIPDRFTDLLAQLRAGGKSDASEGDPDDK